MANALDGVIIEVGATGNTIGGTAAGSGNLISGNAVDGVHLLGSGNLVAGNRIGTNAAGTAAIPNLDDGVVIAAGGGDTIGGTAAGAGNLISGNAFNGMYIAAGIGSILIAGNFIGTNAAGTAALANGLEGIESHGPNETIGGTAAGAGNLISGNAGEGIYLGTGAGTTLIQGNLAGTNAAGTAAIPNGDDGIDAHGTNNTIGGTAAGAGNVASGNAHYGIYLASGTASDLIQGNLVGTNAAGTAALANASMGIELNGTAMTIGGTTAAARNVISGNASDGIDINGAGATNNVIEGDYIGTNAAGSAAIANYAGVEIEGGATGNLIGSNGDGVNDAARAKHHQRQPLRRRMDDRYRDRSERRRRQLHRHRRHRDDCRGQRQHARHRCTITATASAAAS